MIAEKTADMTKMPTHPPNVRASTKRRPTETRANAKRSPPSTSSSYAVLRIFSSQRTPGDDGYGGYFERMAELAKGQPGYLASSARVMPVKLGITVSY